MRVARWFLASAVAQLVFAGLAYGGVQIDKPIDGDSCAEENVAEHATCENSGHYFRASGVDGYYSWQELPVGTPQRLKILYQPDPLLHHTIRVMVLPGCSCGGPITLEVKAHR